MVKKRDKISLLNSEKTKLETTTNGSDWVQAWLNKDRKQNPRLLVFYQLHANNVSMSLNLKSWVNKTVLTKQRGKYGHTHLHIYIPHMRWKSERPFWSFGGNTYHVLPELQTSFHM